MGSFAVVMHMSCMTMQRLQIGLGRKGNRPFHKEIGLDYFVIISLPSCLAVLIKE